MLKLGAMLVATTVVWPDRYGWSPNSGVDLVIRTPDGPVAIPSADAGRRGTVEPVSFLDIEDWLPAGTTVVHRHVSLAAEAAGAEAAIRETAEPALTRAWSSVARKAPGS